jgi:hypothetical protein
MANSALFLRIEEQYVDHLVDILSPSLYTSMAQLYEHSVKIAAQTNRPGDIIAIFRSLLDGVDNWNQSKLEAITEQIKKETSSSNYLDSLIKCVVKSNIILLSYSNQVSDSIGQKFYENLSTVNFLHKCYSFCANDAFNNPWLFLIYDENGNAIPALEVRRNMLVIKANIDLAIKRAVRKMMPLELLTQEFLLNTVDIIANKGYQFELLDQVQGQVGQLQAKRSERISKPQTLQSKLAGAGPSSNVSNVSNPTVPGIAQYQDIDALIKSEAAKTPAEKVKTLLDLDAKSESRQKQLQTMQTRKSSEKNKFKPPTARPSNEDRAAIRPSGDRPEKPRHQGKTYADEDIDIKEFDDQETIEADEDDDDVRETALTTSSVGQGLQIVLDSGKKNASGKSPNKKTHGQPDFDTERVEPGSGNVIERYGKSSRQSVRTKTKKSN